MKLEVSVSELSQLLNLLRPVNAEAEYVVRALERHSFTIEAKADDAGYLLTQVTLEDIVARVNEHAESTGRWFAPRDIVVTHPIKELGLYNIKIRVNERVSAECKIWVIPPMDDVES